MIINKYAMKQKTVLICVVAIFTGFFSSCKDENSAPLSKEKITGYIQKGPFLNGTSISFSELKTDFSQTGKVFTSQITDNMGTFELNNLELSSPFLEIKADGFYFNEVKGATSGSQITLFALADISNTNSLNVNILSTLEKARVLKLVADGKSFTDAKKKALEEILAIFSLSKTDIRNSELLDINKSGDDNAILLAISVILQGYRSEAELSELLANMSADLRDDGKLDNELLQTSLISHAKFLNTSTIRENLVKRYIEVGGSIQIPEFEKYISQFIENSNFTAVSMITYPESVEGILNVLNENNVDFAVSNLDKDEYYSFAADTPNGISLKIKMEYLEGGDPLFKTYGLWAFRWESGTNWKNTTYDGTSGSQIFEIVESGKPGRLKMLFMSGGGAKIRISYYENGSEVVSHSKIITVD